MDPCSLRIHTFSKLLVEGMHHGHAKLGASFFSLDRIHAVRTFFPSKKQTHPSEFLGRGSVSSVIEGREGGKKGVDVVHNGGDPVLRCFTRGLSVSIDSGVMR
jgi:hypothetical protein